MGNISFCSSKLLGTGSRRKGFMHALEGIIAAIVLFFYFSSASLPPLQKNDWTYNSIKQAGAEYINSIDRSDTASLLNNDSKVFSKITNSLFETSDISIMEGGVPPKDLSVGLLGTYGYYYVQNITINERKTRIIYYATNLSDDVSQFDVLLITDPINLAPYASKLKKFLLLGKGIVEVINLTEDNYDLNQSDLFGLENTTYGIIGNNNITYLSEDMRSISEPIKIKHYFSGIPVRSYTVTPSSPPYDVSGLPGPGDVRVGFINLTAGSTGIAIAKNGGGYDSLYVDSNGDYNFSKPPEDAIPHSVGSMFNTSSGNYTVKAFGSGGVYVEARPSDNARLANFFNPLKIAPTEMSWTSAEQSNVYNISTNALGESFTITLSKFPICGDIDTLPAGNHTFGNITQANSNISVALYHNNISVTNISGAFFLNIDLNNDLKYNGAGEGSFGNGEIVRIGPENYRIDSMSSGSSVKFTLYSRDYVPAAIAGDRYSGRTVWMPNITSGGQDSWNYIAAAIIWASPKNKAVFKSFEYNNIVSSKRVFILSGDIFQPYVVEYSRRYQ